MVKQNLLIMKQPELGKKISELRKAKGLTQEELVEKCNLNVRTIQRIEAGEVTPRSYTVKALFEALDFRWEEVKSGFSNEEKKVPAYLYFAFAAGLVYFFLVFLEISMEYDWIEKGPSDHISAFLGVKIATFLTYCTFLYGWIRLETFFTNITLRIALWAMIGANLIWYSVDCFALITNQIELEDYFWIKLTSFGFCYAFMGIGYLTYKNLWSNIPQIVGALGLIAGILTFSGVGVIFGLIPLTLFEIGQLGLLIWAINKIGRTTSPEFTFDGKID